MSGCVEKIGGGTPLDLQYFMDMQESQPARAPDRSAQKWDRRAEAWEQERIHGRKDDERVDCAVAYLRGRGLLCPDDAIADIGCGPGRFVAAFAKHAGWVTGFDLSERMIHYGWAQAKRAGVENVSFRVCDFQTLDVAEEGLEGAFDLVFSSLTPATRGVEGLRRMMAMSRAYCCTTTHIYHQNKLQDRMLEEVFHRSPVQRWGWRWFYALFNTLFLMGYAPETTYDHRSQRRKVYPDQSYVELTMEQTLPEAERTAENGARIRKWLCDRADAGGTVEEEIHTCYGRILWDVRDRADRTAGEPEGEV